MTKQCKCIIMHFKVHMGWLPNWHVPQGQVDSACTVRRALTEYAIHIQPAMLQFVGQGPGKLLEVALARDQQGSKQQGYHT